MAAGLSVGLTGLAAGYAIGIVGDAVSLSRLYIPFNLHNPEMGFGRVLNMPREFDHTCCSLGYSLGWY